MNRFSKSRGFVLLIVIGVLAVVIIYLAAAQSAIQFSFLQSAQVRERLDRAEAASSIMALALAHGGEWAGKTQAMDWNPHLAVQFALTPLAQGDPVWQGLPGIPARPGDALLTIHWNKSLLMPPSTRYLLNVQGNRPGAIAIADAPAAADDASTKTQTRASVPPL